VAKRGDVLVARRKLGFGAEGKAEHFVVLQSEELRGLDTVVVAPLDADGPLYEGDPLVAEVDALLRIVRACVRRAAKAVPLAGLARDQKRTKSRRRYHQDMSTRFGTTIAIA
jgi:hypothetical protein